MPSPEPAGDLAATSPAAARLLPRVIPETPAAVLLVDTDRREVVYASPVAEQLAPQLALPFAIEDWARAADLRDLQGKDLGGTTGSLASLAEGAAPRGQIVTAQRASDISIERELLWTTGVPLADAPGLDRFSLLIFLPLRDTEAIETAIAASGSEVEIRDRAVLATGLAFTVADARAPDQPLVWVNPAFTAATGYTFEDSVGRNCRFLQGPDTEPDAHVTIRRAITEGTELVTTLLNYRKDGTPFWNQLALNPVRDASGTVTHFVGIQTDVTESRRIEREREQALIAERAARQAAEDARAAAEQAQRAAENARAEAERATAQAMDSRRRLALLVEATTQLAATLDLDEALERLIHLAVPRMADWIVIDIPGTDGLERRVIIRDRSERTELTTRLSDLVLRGIDGGTLTGEAQASGQPVLRARVDDDDIARAYPPEMAEVIREMGLTGGMAVPLRARNRMLGVMTFVSDGSGRVFDEDDLKVATDLGRRAALTLDNARLYQIEHQNAETLQRSLLPDLPEVDGITAAARYLAGASSAQVGGDFYEVLDLPDGGIGVAIGDVVGHDLNAAAAMGHLRGLLRACAWDTGQGDAAGAERRETPTAGQVMQRVDRLVLGLQLTTLATVFYGRLERPSRPGAGWRLSYANAGHPPPVVRYPDGSAAALDGDPGILLGVDGDPRGTHEVTLPDGSTIFLFTDGLVERRSADISHGLDWLRDLIETAPLDATPTQLVARATGGLEGVDDDVAVLAVRIG